jgi:STE24 endopeptidase
LSWAAVVLAALVLQLALELAADVLNLRALAPDVPPSLRGLYDAERYRRAQEYTRSRIRFGMVAAVLDLALLVAFWFAGGFAALDVRARGLGGGPVGTGLVFVGLLAAGWALVHLPLRWWSTFVIEARFGFNRTTPATFWADVAKGLVLATLLGGPLLAAVLWLFVHAGGRAWVWGWLVATAFVVALQFVAPTWIMPLFNRFAPLGDGRLRDAILAYARAVGFPLEGVFVIDGSRRSTKANALFTGFGRHKRVALFDTLLQTLDPAELVAVVAHEVGHYQRRHIVQGMALAVLHLGAMLFLLARVLARPELYAAFFVAQPSVHAGLVLFALVLSPVELVLSVPLHALSRRNERAADAFAAATTGSGEPLARGLERLSADSLSNPTPHPLYVALHYSHPPLAERVRALRG